jgi:hypothetical protein
MNRFRPSLRITSRLSLAAAAMFALVAPARAASPIPITACETTIPARQKGILMADLDCGTLVGVVLNRSAALDMNGHSIVTSGEAVRGELDRSGAITVNGPGSISGGCTAAIAAHGNVKDKHRVNARNVTIDGCTLGIAGNTVRANDVSITNGVAAGLYADFGVTGAHILSSGNGTYGVVVPYGTVRVHDLSATDNGWQGVLATLAVLSDSVVTGNDVGGFGIDIGTSLRPRLRDVDCGLSAHEPFLAHVAGPPWGVCTND